MRNYITSFCLLILGTWMICDALGCTKTVQAPALPARTIVLPPVYILKIDTVYIHDTLYICQ